MPREQNRRRQAVRRERHRQFARDLRRQTAPVFSEAPTGQQLGHDDADRIDVDPDGRRANRVLLRCRVVGGQHDGTRDFRALAFVDQARDAKVEHLEHAAFVDEYVGRFQIAGTISEACAAWIARHR